MLSTAAVLACVQGHQFDPPKPLKIDPPKLQLQPPRLDGLFSASPPALLPRTELSPGTSTAPEPARPLATTTTAEQQAVFVAFVQQFDAQRGKGAVASVPDTIDYAVASIHLGRYARSIEILLALESARPGIYETAANLGTAYELAGQLEDAVIWIARGIERNPDSHQGTEWLHAAILHAKLKLRDEPNWLESHSVLEATATGERSAEEIVRAIDYQLAERLQFVTAPDAVVCDLFYQASRHVTGPEAVARRAYYCSESLRFGDLHKAKIARDSKS